jgi:hypothetical protein
MRCLLGRQSKNWLWSRKYGVENVETGGDARHYMSIVELRNDEPTPFFWGGNDGLLLGELLE